MKRLFLIILILLCLYTIAIPEVPRLISFQGKLYDSAGVPLNGTQSISFKIYDAESEGNVLWTESHSSVNINDGIFNVELGLVTVLTLGFDGQYWLGIKVGNDDEMTPRRKLKTSPYSFRAMFSDTSFYIEDGGMAVGGFSVADTFQVGDTFVVTDDGHVGIGTAAPNGKLEVGI